mmetsp:Transcript_46406/g.79053  ORF Transcript_46406/g.79053 Transcript_46406/m.79053 type:complete len:221 (-) Transcript_46406:487-1149(-)
MPPWLVCIKRLLFFQVLSLHKSPHRYAFLEMLLLQLQLLQLLKLQVRHQLLRSGRFGCKAGSEVDGCLVRSVCGGVVALTRVVFSRGLEDKLQGFRGGGRHGATRTPHPTPRRQTWSSPHGIAAAAAAAAVAVGAATCAACPRACCVSPPHNAPLYTCNRWSTRACSCWLSRSCSAVAGAAGSEAEAEAAEAAFLAAIAAFTSGDAASAAAAAAIAAGEE